MPEIINSIINDSMHSSFTKYRVIRHITISHFVFGEQNVRMNLGKYPVSQCPFNICILLKVNIFHVCSLIKTKLMITFV